MEDDQSFYSFDDSPSVRAAMRGQVQCLRASESSVIAFAARAEQLSASFASIGLDSSPAAALLSEEEFSKLAVGDTLAQLRDFCDNLQHQLARNVVEPLRAYHASIGEALKAARAFDEESEALDALHLKYLSLSKEAPVETRAHAHADLCDRAAGVALRLLDARTLLDAACAAQRIVPQRALSELLVAQLAYHQSCTRLLSTIMPAISGLLAQADAAQAAADADTAAAATHRASMPQPQTREDESTVLEGWLYKGAFNLTHDGASEGSVKGQLSARLKPWNKRYFVLSDNGKGQAKLYYYKTPEEAKVAKVPIDMNLLSAVHAVNGPLELELRIGRRLLRLKALETADRDRWMIALTTYVQTHQDEHRAAMALNQRRYEQASGAVGVRDLDGDLSRHRPGHSRNTHAGWLYRQDQDMMKRWRKWWCVVGGDGSLSCTQYDSLKVAEETKEGKPASSTSKLRGHHSGDAKERVVRTPRMSSVSTQSSVWGRIRRSEGNDQCADCGAVHPSWASINLGVIICLNCSGIHRRMGVHISKVRSLELDTKEWSVPLVSVMTSLGNATLNRIWHAPPPGSLAAGAESIEEAGQAGKVGQAGKAGQATDASKTLARPGPEASTAEREVYIRKKYEARAFLDATARPPEPSLHLAAVHDDAPLAAACLIHGLGFDVPAPAVAKGEWSSAMAREHRGRTALQIAAAVGAETVLELLLQNLAASAGGVDVSDSLGKSALTLAVDAGQAGCVEQLITRGANISHADHSQETPMVVAAARGHDAIVATMLDYKLAQDEKLLRQIDVGDD